MCTVRAQHMKEAQGNHPGSGNHTVPANSPHLPVVCAAPYMQHTQLHRNANTSTADGSHAHLPVVCAVRTQRVEQALLAQALPTTTPTGITNLSPSSHNTKQPLMNTLMNTLFLHLSTSHLPVVCAVGTQHVEQALLAWALPLVEEHVVGEGAVQVSHDLQVHGVAA